MSTWQWIIGQLVTVGLVVAGVAFLDRRRAAATEQGKEDHARTKVALKAIGDMDQRLADIQSGFAKPPREEPDLVIDKDGKISGFTSYGGNTPSVIHEVLFALVCLDAVRWRGRLRQKFARHTLTRLCGQAIVDMAQTSAARTGNEMQVLTTAMSATFAGRRSYSRHQHGGRLGDALTEGKSNEFTVGEARALLHRLHRLV